MATSHINVNYTALVKWRYRVGTPTHSSQYDERHQRTARADCVPDCITMQGITERILLLWLPRRYLPRLVVGFRVCDGMCHFRAYARYEKRNQRRLRARFTTRTRFTPHHVGAATATHLLHLGLCDRFFHRDVDFNLRDPCSVGYMGVYWYARIRKEVFEIPKRKYLTPYPPDWRSSYQFLFDAPCHELYVEQQPRRRQFADTNRVFHHIQGVPHSTAKRKHAIDGEYV